MFEVIEISMFCMFSSMSNLHVCSTQFMLLRTYKLQLTKIVKKINLVDVARDFISVNFSKFRVFWQFYREFSGQLNVVNVRY